MLLLIILICSIDYDKPTSYNTQEQQSKNNGEIENPFNKYEDTLIGSVAGVVLSNGSPNDAAKLGNIFITHYTGHYPSISYPLRPFGAGGYARPHGYHGNGGGSLSYNTDIDLVDMLLEMCIW